jgi:hypothetical protein
MIAEQCSTRYRLPIMIRNLSPEYVFLRAQLSMNLLNYLLNPVRSGVLKILNFARENHVAHRIKEMVSLKEFVPQYFLCHHCYCHFRILLTMKIGSPLVEMIVGHNLRTHTQYQLLYQSIPVITEERMKSRLVRVLAIYYCNKSY